MLTKDFLQATYLASCLRLRRCCSCALHCNVRMSAPRLTRVTETYSACSFMRQLFVRSTMRASQVKPCILKNVTAYAGLTGGRRTVRALKHGSRVEPSNCLSAVAFFPLLCTGMTASPATMVRPTHSEAMMSGPVKRTLMKRGGSSRNTMSPGLAARSRAAVAANDSG